MDSTDSQTVVVSRDAVILTREQAEYLLRRLAGDGMERSRMIRDAITEQVGPR